MKHQACIMCMGIPDMVKFTERWDGGMAFPARLQRLWLSVSSLAASARKNNAQVVQSFGEAFEM